MVFPENVNTTTDDDDDVDNDYEKPHADDADNNKHGGNFCPIRFLGASKPMKTQTFANRQFFCSTVFKC